MRSVEKVEDRRKVERKYYSFETFEVALVPRASSFFVKALASNVG